MKRIQIRKLDILWAKKVKERDKACMVNGCKGDFLNAAHVIGRTHYAIRWDLKNGITLCVTHHRDYDEHRKYMADIVQEKLGLGLIEELEKKAQQVGIKRDFEGVWEELNGKP